MKALQISNENDSQARSAANTDDVPEQEEFKLSPRQPGIVENFTPKIRIAPLIEGNENPNMPNAIQTPP